MQPVAKVNIDRFMGQWYVLAHIPTLPERGAIDPIEHYSLNADGTIKTTFTFRKEPGGELKELEAKGFVREDSSNAVWGMQFIWPIKADYRIVYLDPSYQTTIIGRNKRDYVWIMSRAPAIPDNELDALIDIVESLGYDRSKVRITNWQQPLQAAS